MTEPFVLISTSEIKEGHLEEYKIFSKKMIGIIEANEPRLIAFGTYVNEEGTKVTTIQVHPDADSFVFHLGLIRDKMDIAFEHIELKSMMVAGEMTEQVREMINRFATSGVSVNINPEPIVGFSRFLS